ncbi:hypothetical protein HDE_05522 [Halotydeus destructor]|nr:hypothetical protein HDE_05522 [Halotydeus destructor]
MFKSTDGTAEAEWYRRALDFMLYLHIPLKKQWYLVSVLIYIVNLIQWSMAETIFIAQLADRRNAHQISAIIKRRQLLNNVKRHFNDVFCPFPLIWLTSLFLQSSGLILNMQGRPDSIEYYRLIVYGLEAIFMVVILGLVIFLENRNKEAMRKLLSELDLFNRPATDLAELQDWFKLKDCMNENVELHAMLFKLDRSLILGFIGSLITFSVMFVQLTHNYT